MDVKMRKGADVSSDKERDRMMVPTHLENKWEEFDVKLYTDGLAQAGNAKRDSGVIVTTDPPSDPKDLQSCALLAGEWFSSFQAEVKAVKATPNTINETEK